MSTTIDTLSIEIESNSTKASSSIRELAKSLGELKTNGTVTTAVKNLNSLSAALKGFTDASNATRSLGKLVGALARLKEVGPVGSVGNSITKLSNSLKALDNVKIDNVAPKIEQIAQAVAPLSAIKAGGLNTMVNALSKIGKVTADLDDAKIAAFAERIEKLNTALEPLSTKMTTIQAGLRGINSSARSAGSGVKQMGEDINASALNMSSLIHIVQSVVQWLQVAIEKFSQFMAQAIEWDGIAARFGRGFGPQAQETYEWIQRLNEEMGINVQQFMQYSSIYATMLTGFGVATEDATKMALGYTELTYDIWAGYNDVYKTYEEASEAVKSAIAGEVEPIRRAGFTIIESTLEQTAANHGLEISLANATEAQKSYLRYLTLVDQAHAQNLVGTYAKELNTAEGLMRTFSQQLKSLSQAFGSLFLPALTAVMPYLQAFVEMLIDAVHWIASLFGIEIQAVDWSGYNSGVGEAVENTEKLEEQMGGAAKAAKDLKNATLGIDELNVISPPSASGGGGGGKDKDGGGGFDGLDIDSLWDESIFDNIQSKVKDIKAALEDWLPVIGTIAGALAGLTVASLITSIGNALSEMNVLQKAAASIAILTIEAALVFVFADNYLESGNLLYLIGEALVTATAGYLMFRAWGPAGATLALGVSILAQLIALKASLADGTVTLTSPETWIQGITTILMGAFGGALITKNTGFFAKEGFMIGLGVTASLTLSAIRLGAIESGEIESGSVESWIMEIGSVISAGLAGKWLGSALYTKGGPAGALIGVTAGLVLNLVGTIEVKGEDFGNEISDWINVGLTTAATGFTAVKLWGIIKGTVVPALKGLVTTHLAPAVTTALGGIATALGVSVGWAAAIVAAIVAAIAGAIYVATHWEEVKSFFTKTIPEWFSQTGETLKEFFTKSVPEWFSGAWEAIQKFFSETVPNFITETLPNWAGNIGYGLGYVVGAAAKFIVDWWNEDVVPFFTETIPNFFTETVPDFFSDAWKWVKNYFTVTVPDFFSERWEKTKKFFSETVPDFFTKKIPEWFAGAWAWVKNFFEKTVPDWFAARWEDIKEIGKNLVDGLWGGIKGRWDWFIDMASSFIDGIIQGFKDAFGIASPSTVFADMGKWLIEGLWEGIKNKVDWIIEKIGGWVDSVLVAVKDFFGIKSPSKKFKEIGGYLTEGLVEGFTDGSALIDPLKKMWDKAKGWWEDTDFSLSLTPDVGSMTTKLKSSWDSAKKWWSTSKGTLSTYTPSIGSISSKLSSAWSAAKTWWSKKKGSLSTYTPSIGSIKTKLSSSWSSARDWWNKKKPKMSTLTPAIGSFTDKLKSSWNSAKKWWNKNVRLDTKLNVKVPTIKVNWDTATAFGKSFKYPTGFKIKFAAAGGIFDAGSLIWAGERGAEVVANAGGGKTGVMNINQMQDAVFEGVYAAVMAANRATSGDGTPAFNIYLDGKQITATVEKRQRERGTSIMGNQVYTYG